MRTRFFAASLAAGLVSAAASAAPCDGILPDMQAAAPQRDVTLLDIARVRDFGYYLILQGQRILSVSPDGRSIAFVLLRADPASNRNCSALVTLGLEPGARPVVLDRGDETLLDKIELRGVRIDNGRLSTQMPVWSPDGSQVAWRKRVGGSTQAWRVPAGGGAPTQVSHAPEDVEDIAWSTDGAALLFAARNGLADAKKALEQEGTQGYLYDYRTLPYAGARPQLPQGVPLSYQAIELATGTPRAATKGEEARFTTGFGSDELWDVAGSDGSHARTIRETPGDALSPVRLVVQRPGGEQVRCEDAACSVPLQHLASYVGWSADGNDILFERREGWLNSETGFYRWSPKSGQVRRLLGTEDRIDGCQPLGANLLCAREGTAQPRRLVLIDTTTGAERVVFDPNPEFQSLRLGKVERVHWRAPNGIENYGDFVLPPDWKPGQKLPMIVVGYRTGGFLRGGVGDELPVHAFAAAGYAVFSYNAPSSFAADKRTKKAQTADQVYANTVKNWGYRKEVHASVMKGIDTVLARGIVDPKKVGWWGLSDGTTTGQWAFNNALGKFAAASFGACCMEQSLVFTGGIGFVEQLRKSNFPPFRGPGSDGWKQAGTAPNAARLDVPLLMQQGELEYLLVLDTYAALRDAGKPVELYTFPDTGHLKWQPAQRLATYQRNLDWFDFWLRGKQDPDPAKEAQYARWREMRDHWKKAPAARS